MQILTTVQFTVRLIYQHTKPRHLNAQFGILLRLHYVPGGHGSHDFGHRGRNGVTVTQRRGAGSTNVARRGRREKFATAATARLTYLNVP